MSPGSDTAVASAPEKPAPRARRAVPVRALALGAVLAVAGLAAFLLLRGGASSAPADEAARLVPPGALVYARLSTDPERDGTKTALVLARRFSSFARGREALLSRLQAGSTPVVFDRDIRPWLGREAALALVPGARGAANSLIVVGVKDRPKAEGFLRRAAGGASGQLYRGTLVRAYGAVSTAFVGSSLVIGQAADVRGAVDRGAGRVPSLARSPLYARARAGEPDGRVADVYASGDGVRRLLAPQPGVFGALGQLLDRPGLAATDVAVTAAGPTLARVRAHAVLAAGAPGRRPVAPTDPILVRSAPADSLLFSEADGIGGGLARLIGAQGGPTSVLAQLLGRVRQTLTQRSGGGFERDVLPLFRRRLGVAVQPGFPAPTLILVAPTPNAARLRQTLAQLQEPLARSLRQPGTQNAFVERDVGSTRAFSLKIANGLELDYAVVDRRLILATSLGGIAAARDANGALERTPGFQGTVGDAPSGPNSVTYALFSQLLRLSQSAGLGQNPAFLAVRDDLERISAVSAVTGPGKQHDIISDFVLRIP